MSWCQPTDLLQLARTSKPLRATLLNRDTASALWRRARANVACTPPVPACPPFMSEPYFTALLFEPRCQLCGAQDTEKPGMVGTLLYGFRVRRCEVCQKL